MNFRFPRRSEAPLYSYAETVLDLRGDPIELT